MYVARCWLLAAYAARVSVDVSGETNDGSLASSLVGSELHSGPSGDNGPMLELCGTCLQMTPGMWRMDLC